MEEFVNSRRKFIRNSVLGTGALLLSQVPFSSALAYEDSITIRILHTNDWHSRIEAFPKNDPNFPGMGGAEKRMAIIEQIRKQCEHVLLLDAGDMFQGTPYFNLYGGEAEFRIMSEMKYDAATLGNHDFDGGLQGLIKQLPHASFEILNANYTFSELALKNKIKPWKIFKKGPIKIGVFGIGIELRGLVPDNLFGATQYKNPVEIANQTAWYLKSVEKCDLVICLSHLGYSYAQAKVSDLVLAKETSGIDLIIGGHTHTFLKEPVIEKNKENQPVIINQVGWAGIMLGQIDFVFNKTKKKLKLAHTTNSFIKSNVS